jgi:TPR repeat protein
MYENGDGVEQDSAEAVRWYKKAAEQGDADAQNKVDELIKQMEQK